MKMRYILLGLMVFLLLSVLAVMIFYYDNEESAPSILIKLIAPMLIGILWVLAAITDFDRTSEEYFGSIIVVNEDHIPFRVLQTDINRHVNIQKLLPISFGTSDLEGDEDILRIFKGGVWLSLLESIQNCWALREIKVYAFGGASFRSWCDEDITSINVTEKLFKLRVRDTYDFSDPFNSIIGFPLGTKIRDYSDNEIIIDTPQLELKILIHLTSESDFPSFISKQNKDVYEFIAHAKNTFQGSKFKTYGFILTISRTVKWRYQWSTQTKLQIEWSDDLIKSLRKIIEWESYQEALIKELHRLNQKSEGYSGKVRYDRHKELVNIRLNDTKKDAIKKIIIENIKTNFEEKSDSINIEMSISTRRTFEHILRHLNITFNSKDQFIYIE